MRGEKLTYKQNIKKKLILCMAYFVLQRPPKCWVIHFINNDVLKLVYNIRILLHKICSRYTTDTVFKIFQ